MKKKISTVLLAGLLSASMAVAPVYGASTQKKITDAKNAKQEQQKQLNDTQNRLNNLEAKKGNLGLISKSWTSSFQSWRQTF